MKVLQILILIFGLTVFANAQNDLQEQKNSEQKMTLTGAVFDTYGSVIVNAEIIAYRNNGTIYKSKTLDEGIYELILPLDVYKIEVSAVGFCKSRIEQYQIVNSTYGKMNLDFVLEVRTLKSCKFDEKGGSKQKKKAKKKDIIIIE